MACNVRLEGIESGHLLCCLGGGAVSWYSMIFVQWESTVCIVGECTGKLSPPGLIQSQAQDRPFGVSAESTLMKCPKLSGVRSDGKLTKQRTGLSILSVRSSKAGGNVSNKRKE